MSYQRRNFTVRDTYSLETLALPTLLYYYITQLWIRYYQAQEVWTRTSHGSKNIHSAGKKSQKWDSFSCSVKGLILVRLWTCC